MVQILSLLISALAAAQPICLRPRFSKKLLTPVIIMFFLHLPFPQQLHSLLPQVTTSGRKNISIVQIVQAKLMYASALVNTAISGWIKIWKPVTMQLVRLPQSQRIWQVYMTDNLIESWILWPVVTSHMKIIPVKFQFFSKLYLPQAACTCTTQTSQQSISTLLLHLPMFPVKCPKETVCLYTKDSMHCSGWKPDFPIPADICGSMRDWLWLLWTISGVALIPADG